MEGRPQHIPCSRTERAYGDVMGVEVVVEGLPKSFGTQPVRSGLTEEVRAGYGFTDGIPGPARQRCAMETKSGGRR